MGTKRSWEGQPVPIISNDNMTEPVGPIISIFENFRNELDEHHDQNVRSPLTLNSNILILTFSPSIFALQRVHAINEPIPPKIAKDNQDRLDQIQKLFTSIVPDVTDLNTWRYQRQVSGGIQEFIEAISFDHYLRTQTLITHEEVSGRLPAEIEVTADDYLGGLFDLTGEMMRFAVTTLGSGSTETEEPTDEPTSQIQGPRLSKTQAGIVVDLRAMRAHTERLSIPRRHAFMMRDYGKKLEVMQSSVEKVERAAYGILVRGSERPKGWMPDLSVPMQVET
ncbi:hypothetical protein N7495_007353 [Penicillium taxi]|uniref:uncharacterized protein n=1 Tax=Penicillium taxi TaxID=168475 RepID=UPI002545371E|nr:uncharacterized protein N7495_007353 [Penicillium taxi]KAJ5895662.1 hypothetical protein N7495_007353 [Penicillium taxi]